MGQDITERLAVSYPDKPSYGDLIEAIDAIKNLRAECLRLSYAETDAMAVVLSQEEQIERLRAKFTQMETAYETARQDCLNLTEKVIPNLRAEVARLEQGGDGLSRAVERLRAESAAFEQAWKDACARAEKTEEELSAEKQATTQLQLALGAKDYDLTEARAELAESKKLLDIALPNDDDKRFMQFIGDTLKLATSTVENQKAAIAALKALLRELVILEADGKHADESAIEVWDRARAALGEGE